MAFEDIGEFFIFMQITTFEQSNVRILIFVHFCLGIIMNPHHIQALGTDNLILQQYFHNEISNLQHFLKFFILLYLEVNYSNVLGTV